MIPSTAKLQAIRDFVNGDGRYSGKTADEMTTLLNQPRSQTPPVYVARPMSKGEFMLLITPAVMAMLGAGAELQAKWGTVLDILKAAPDAQLVDVTLPTMQGILAGIVTDGLMAQEAVDAILASGRTEVLKADVEQFGYMALTVSDVTAALAS